LSVKTDGCCRRDAVQDVEAVSDGRGRTLRPAGATVLRDVLVLVPAEVIGAVLVPPVDGFGQVLLCDQIPAVWRVLDLTESKAGLADAAALPAGKELFVGKRLGRWVVLGLRECVDGVVVVGVCFLLISCLMPYLVGPGVLGSAPCAARLNSNIVHALADPEETLLAPVGTP